MVVGTVMVVVLADAVKVDWAAVTPMHEQALEYRTVLEHAKA